MVVEEYNHSKTSPAYRKLNTKYKALKSTNAELMRLLTNIFAELNSSRRVEEEYVPRPKTKKSKTKSTPMLRKVSQLPVVNDSDSDSDSEQEQDKKQEQISCIVNDLVDKVLAKDVREVVIDVEIVEEVTDTNTEPDAKTEIVVEPTETVDIEKKEQTEEVDEGNKEEIVEEEDIEENKEEIVEEEDIEGNKEEIVEEEEEEDIEGNKEEIVEEVEEEEEAGVYEIEINGVRYYTTNEQDGIVYAVMDDDDVGDEVGNFVKGKLVFNK